jgi:site-specific DNA-cytosine methylase
MTYPLDGFDAIHASPPCQAYSAGRNIWKGRLPDDRHPDLVAPTRARLIASGVPYVIENVIGAGRALIPAYLEALRAQRYRIASVALGAPEVVAAWARQVSVQP